MITERVHRGGATPPERLAVAGRSTRCRTRKIPRRGEHRRPRPRSGMRFRSVVLAPLAQYVGNR